MVVLGMMVLGVVVLGMMVLGVVVLGIEVLGMKVLALGTPNAFVTLTENNSLAATPKQDPRHDVARGRMNLDVAANSANSANNGSDLKRIFEAVDLLAELTPKP